MIELSAAVLAVFCLAVAIHFFRKARGIRIKIQSYDERSGLAAAMRRAQRSSPRVTSDRLVDYLSTYMEGDEGHAGPATGPNWMFVASLRRGESLLHRAVTQLWMKDPEEVIAGSQTILAIGDSGLIPVVREAAELWAEDEHVSIQLRRTLERLQSRELQATTMSDVKP